MAIAAADALIHEYADEFLEKVFYFCLRKCGGVTAAEDLAGDITLSIVTQLRRGAVPESFPAWVWKIARNRYSKWALSARKTRELFTADELSELDIASDTAVGDALMHDEELRLLRRELAFVARDYREILVAYYIENRKTDEIAMTLNIPKGTVVSKLHRIRKKLKEGMSMSREFGKLSYNPENVGFVMNGQSGRDGTPWCFLSRLLSKNVLLAAYRNPSTAEELAIELGIALPYMEDELSQLVQFELMKKNGDKYETAIFIVSAKAQERCYLHMASIAAELSSLAIKTVEFRIRCYEENGVKWHEGYQNYEDMKWALLMRRVDDFYFDVIRRHPPEKDVPNISRNRHTRRPSGGEWDLLGLEDCKIDRPPFIGLHGTGETYDYGSYNYQFGQYKFQYEKITEQTPVQLSENQCRALVDIARQTAEKTPLVILDELVQFGYLRKDGEAYRPTFMVTFSDKLGELTEEQKAEYQRLAKPAIELLDSLYLVCREAVTSEVPVFLREDEHQISHAIANLMFPRESVFKAALDSGWLSYDVNDPDSAKRRMLGAYLVI
ncbi:MAG: RNA polymerase sigma factor [Oscillospiraceae bacterium]|jgi:RNA polymerase sigma factor (sigma-70 family)|nr:RNA polymerase sigma factor [Oscillospiraceae bacterium]